MKLKRFLLRGFLPVGCVLTVALSLHHFARATENGSEHVAMFTPPFFTTGGNFLDCRLVNIRTDNIIARIQIFAQNGSAIADTGEQSVSAGSVMFVFANSTNDPQYCRFSGEFSRKDIRAIGAVYNSTVQPVAAAPAE